MTIAIDIRALMDGRVSGVTVYIKSLLGELFRIDKKNKYILFYNSFSDVKANIPIFGNSNVQIIYTRIPNRILNFTLRFFKWPKLDKLVQKRIYRKFRRRFKIDIFFVPDPRPVALSEGIKMITTFHDLSFVHYKKAFSFKTRLWHILMKPERLAKDSSKIIAVSNFTKKDLISTYGINKDKIKVVYHGKEEFESASLIKKSLNQNFDQKCRDKMPLHPYNEIREKYSLPSQFILSLSTIEYRKNLNNLLKGFEQFKVDNKSNCALVLAGEKQSDIFREVNLDPKENIIFAGFIQPDDKYFVYRMASSFVYISFYEGFGLPVLEAMSVGIPVVVSKGTSMEEIVGDSGILIDPYDIGDIADGIEKSLNKKYTQSLIEKARERSRFFTWKKCVRETLKVLMG